MRVWRMYLVGCPPPSPCSECRTCLISSPHRLGSCLHVYGRSLSSVTQYLYYSLNSTAEKCVDNPPFFIGAFIPETFRKWVVVYLKFCYLWKRWVGIELKAQHWFWICSTSWCCLTAAETDLGVLVSGDCCEGRLGEGEGLENTPTDTEQVVCLNHVETWVVAMHRVQNDLQAWDRSEGSVAAFRKPAQDLSVSL